MHRYLAVIPARGGSKGVPGKNRLPIAGKPLVRWSIDAARASERLGDVRVSTDDAAIAAIAKDAGVAVHERPAALAGDEATTVSVLQHVLQQPSAEAFTHVVVLQPTSPVRSPGLIDRCIAAFERQPGADNLATGFWCKYRAFGSYDNLRRQDLKGFFYDDGNVYVLSRALVEAGRWSGSHIVRFETQTPERYEIDDPLDFWLLERLLEARPFTGEGLETRLQKELALRLQRLPDAGAK